LYRISPDNTDLGLPVEGLYKALHSAWVKLKDVVQHTVKLDIEPRRPGSMLGRRLSDFMLLERRPLKPAERGELGDPATLSSVARELVIWRDAKPDLRPFNPRKTGQI
jgi:hypothetical protein